MKIAFFNYVPLEYGGGLAKYYLEISTGLKKRYPKLEISIVTFDEKYSKNISKIYSLYFLTKRYSKKISSSDNFKSKISKIPYLKAKDLSDLKQILSSFDVIYSKNDFVEATILRVIKLNINSRIIFGFHTPVSYDRTFTIQDKLHNLIYNSFLYKYLIKNTGKIHVLNNFDKNLLEKKFSDIPVFLIQNPFNFAAFENKANLYLYNLRLNVKNTTILWVGRLTKEKGIHELEEIIVDVNKSHEKRVTWVIIGDGPLIGSINYLKKKHDNIIHLKYIENDYIASIYKRADLYISTSHFECFPYTFLEAQSLGVPVVSYNIHGSSDIIKHGENGFLVGNTKQFAGTIKNFTTHKYFTKQQIKTYIAKKYDANTLYKLFYSELLKSYDQTL